MKINLKTLLRGAGIAAMLSILAAIVTFSQAGAFPTVWAGISGWGVPVYVMIAAFFGYIIKTLITGTYPSAELFAINFWDILKGAVLAAITSILTAITTFTQAGHFPTCWSCDGGWNVPVYAAIGVFALYILKNYVTNSEGKFAKEPAK